ncbi:MAG: DUF6691 family protein, partial [Bacteroidota bacterium]
VLGALLHFWIKKSNLKNAAGESIQFSDKPTTYKASLLGGTLFGLGWALTGACPGPLYTLVGHGFGIILVVILSALVGTFAYGLLRHKLPH